jgi:hypothetical protein
MLSCTQVLEWHKQFTAGREEVEDDKHPGHLSTSKTEDNVMKTSEIVW